MASRSTTTRWPVRTSGGSATVPTTRSSPWGCVEHHRRRRRDHRSLHALRARAGGEEALLLDAGEFADPRAGTAKSAAIVRMHYSNPEVVRMAVQSRAAFMQQPFYERCGWLFLVDDAHAGAARRNREMQQAEGALSEEVDPADFEISAEGVAYALFE